MESLLKELGELEERCQHQLSHCHLPNTSIPPLPTSFSLCPSLSFRRPNCCSSLCSVCSRALRLRQHAQAATEAVAQFSRQTEREGGEGLVESTEDVDPHLLLSSSHSAPLSSSSSSFPPVSALELLEALWLYRDLYEDECQVKQSILSSFLHSARSSLSTASSSPPLLAGSHSNWQLMWRAQVGLDQQRLEEGWETLRRDAEWRRRERTEEEGEGGKKPSRRLDFPHSPQSPSQAADSAAPSGPQQQRASATENVEGQVKDMDKGQQQKKKKKKK